MARMLAFAFLVLAAFFSLLLWWFGSPLGAYSSLPIVLGVVVVALQQFFEMRTVKRRLSQLGWDVRWKDVLGRLSAVGLRDLDYLLPREEFSILPEYHSDWRESDNILACIEFSKREEQSRKTYVAIRPYIAEHEREGRKPPM